MVATGLLSLLITHQLVWIQLTTLTIRMQSPLVWLSPLNRALAIPQPVWPPPNPLRFPSLTVKEPFIDLVAFAPRDRDIWLSRNGFDFRTLSNSYGRILFPTMPLREGPNEIVAQVLGPNRASWKPAYMAGLQVNFKPQYQHPPAIVDAYTTKSGVTVRGLALPYSSVRVKYGTVVVPAPTDWIGAFKINLSDRPPIEVAADASAFGTDQSRRVSAWQETAAGPDLTEPDLPDERFSRRVRMKLSGDRFELHLFARLSQDTPLWNWVSNSLISGPELSRGLFGLCLQVNVPMNEYIIGSRFFSRMNHQEPDTEGVIAYLNWCSGGPSWIGTLPASESLDFQVSPNQESVEMNVRGRLPKDGVRLELHPFSRLVDPPLSLPAEEVRIETEQPDQVRVNIPPAMTDKGLFVWRSQPDTGKPLREIVLAEINPAEPPAADSRATVSVAPQSADNPAEQGGGREATDSGGQPQVETGEEKEDGRDQSEATAPQQTIVDFIRAIEQAIPEKLNRIFLALLTAVPFIGFLWILRLCGTSIPRGFAASLYAGTLVLLVLHLTIFAVSLFSVSLDFLDLAFGQTGGSRIAMGALAAAKGLGNIYPFLGIGVVLLLRPIYQAARSNELWPQASRIRMRPLCWFLFVLTTVVAPVATLYAIAWVMIDTGSSQSLVSDRLLYVTGGVLAGGLILLWYQLYWLIRGILGLPIRTRPTIFATSAMLLLPVIPAAADATMGLVRRAAISRLQFYPFLLPAEMTNTMWFLVVTVLGAALLYEIAIIGVRLSEKRGIYRVLKSRKAWAIFAGLILLSMPLDYLLGNDSGLKVDISRFTTLAYSVDDLLPYALLPGIVVLIRLLNRKDGFHLSSGSVLAGALLFSFYLTGRTSNLLFIPIPLLVGYYLFTRWTLALDAAPRLAVTPEIVSRLVKYKQSVSLARSLERAIEKKYTAGDVTLEDYRKKVAESKRAECEAAAQLKVAVGTTSPEIFTYGPESGPWENAKVAVRYGLIISLPFQAITLMSVLQPRGASGFPFIDVLKALLFSTSSWLLTAFVFGYFFHRIRGLSGLVKALVYSATLVVPTVPMRLIAAEPLGGPGHLLQIGEITGFVLILALVAFDYRNLQTLGRPWRDMLTIYGWNGVTAYASSIVLALGSSFATKVLPHILDLLSKKPES
jgi:hypothetical protein